MAGSTSSSTSCIRIKDGPSFLPPAMERTPTPPQKKIRFHVPTLCQISNYFLFVHVRNQNIKIQSHLIMRDVVPVKQTLRRALHGLKDRFQTFHTYLKNISCAIMNLVNLCILSNSRVLIKVLLTSKHTTMQLNALHI